MRGSAQTLLGSPRGGGTRRCTAAGKALDERLRAPGRPCVRAHLAGGRLHRRAGGRAARAGDLSELHQRDRRLAAWQMDRPRQLPSRVDEPGLPGRRLAHVPVHGHLAGHRACRGGATGSRAAQEVPRQVVPPLPDPPALGGAAAAQPHGLDVDLRHDLLDHQLDAATPPPREHGVTAAVAGAAAAGDGVRDRGPCVADHSLRDGDLPGRSRLDSQGGRRRRGDRRRNGAPQVLVRLPAAAVADRNRRAAVRDRLYRDGHGRRLHPDQRRPVAVQLHGDGHDLGVQDGDRDRLARRRGGNLPIPLTCVGRCRNRDADRRAPRGGDVAVDAVLRGFRDKGMSYLIVGPFAIVLAFPFYVMLITAFKQQRDFYDLAHTPYWFHKGPTLANARFLFNETPYTQWLRNTAIIGVAVVLITLVLAVPAGYALARLSGKVGQSVGVGIFLTYLVPPTLLFLPLFSVITQLDRQTSHLLHFHLRGSIWSLVLVYPSFTVPFATWLLMGFFKTIPRELEDAALIDGASRLGTLVRIVFPISVPGILTVVIFSFSLVVNEFVYAFTFISASAHRTLSTGVYTDLIRGDLPQWGAIMVASLIPSIPLALLYNTFLDRFIAGFTGGAFR